MEIIFKKATGALVLGAFIMGAGLFGSVVPALADEPAAYVSAPQEKDWQTIHTATPVSNQQGVMFLPLRATFESLGYGLEVNPDGQGNKIRLASNTASYELFTYNNEHGTHIGVTANGPWYQMRNINGSLFIPMSFLQSLTNRQVSVVGEQSVAFVDAAPAWAQNEQGYFNQNPFWKGTMSVYNAQVAEPQAQAQPQAAMTTNAMASVNGNTVIEAAQKELGVPYVWGGMSPSGFDCSGLTSYVFAQQGKALPRTASAQQSFAKPVSLDQLQPGDLVFWGQPAYHVGIYIGNGQYIHAPQPGQNVSVGSVQWYPYTGAGRV